MPTLWPHAPSATLEVMTYQTDVLNAYSAEMRYSAHDAVQVIANSYRYTAQQAARAEWLLRSAPDGEWYLPLWHDRTKSAAAINSGATTLPVNTDAEYVAGGYAAIIGTDENSEVAEIATVGSGTITLTGAVSGSYGVGTTIAPVRTCIAPMGLERARQYGIVSHTMVFRALEGVDLASSPFDQLDGFDVVTDAPQAQRPYQGQVSRDQQLFDSGRGSYAILPNESYTRDWSVVEYADHTPAERWRRRQWLHSVRGKDRAFWMPSYVGELALASDATAAGTQIKVKAFAANPAQIVGRAIHISEGGVSVSRVITAQATAAGVHTLDIAAPGADFTKAARVSLMVKSRFDTDRFEIEHSQTATGYLSRFGAPIVEVPA